MKNLNYTHPSYLKEVIEYCKGNFKGKGKWEINFLRRIICCEEFNTVITTFLDDKKSLSIFESFKSYQERSTTREASEYRPTEKQQFYIAAMLLNQISLKDILTMAYGKNTKHDFTEFLNSIEG